MGTCSPRQKHPDNSYCTTSPWWQSLETEIGLIRNYNPSPFSLFFIFSFSFWCWGLKPGVHTCQTQALLLNYTPQPYPYFFKSSKPLSHSSRCQVQTHKQSQDLTSVRLGASDNASGDFYPLSPVLSLPTTLGLMMQADRFISTAFPAFSLSPSTSLNFRKGQQWPMKPWHDLAWRSPRDIYHQSSQDPVLRF